MVFTEGGLIVINALCDPTVNVRELKLDDTRLDQLPISLEPFAIMSSETMSSVAEGLTRLTTSCRNSNEHWDSDFIGEGHAWDSSFFNAVNLQSLKIFIGVASDLWRWQRLAGVPSIVEHALKHDRMPALQHIEIIVQTVNPRLIRADRLGPLLRNHQAHLQTVKLSGVLFEPPRTLTGQLCGTITHLLNSIRMIRANPTLSGSSRDEHGQGGCNSDSCHVDRCESYALQSYHYIHRSELETLANGLGMALRAGCWDFGEYVMHKPQ